MRLSRLYKLSDLVPEALAVGERGRGSGGWRGDDDRRKRRKPTRREGAALEHSLELLQDFLRLLRR